MRQNSAHNPGGLGVPILSLASPIENEPRKRKCASVAHSLILAKYLGLDYSILYDWSSTGVVAPAAKQPAM